MVDPRYGLTPYIQQWNLNLQKQLPGKILVDAGYIGNKGTKLRYRGLERLNQTPASVIAQYGTNLPRTITSAADAAKYGAPYPYPGFSGTVNSALRQFPQLRGQQHRFQYRRQQRDVELPLVQRDRQPPVPPGPVGLRQLGLVEDH